MDNQQLRREFLKRAGWSAAALTLGGTSHLPAEGPVRRPAQEPKGPKVKIGIVGGGHRGNFVGGFMQRHGG